MTSALAARRRLPKQSREPIEVAGGKIGYGAIHHTVCGPPDEIVALQSALFGRGIFAHWHRDEADQVLAMTVDKRRHRRAPNNVDAPAEQWKSVLSEINDARRLRDAAAEPRFHGVAIGGCDVGGLRGHQPPHVTGNDRLVDTIPGIWIIGIEAQREPGSAAGYESGSKDRRRQRAP